MQSLFYVKPQIHMRRTFCNGTNIYHKKYSFCRRILVIGYIPLKRFCIHFLVITTYFVLLQKDFKINIRYRRIFKFNVISFVEDIL